MSMFEIYLLKPADGTTSAEAVLDALGRENRVGLTADDPSRAHCRNPDTGVFFSMLLAPEVTDVWHARLAAARRTDDDYPPPPDETSCREDEDAFDTDEDEAEGPHIDVEQAPVILNVPLFAMEFFVREAFACAAEVANATGLSIDLHAAAEEHAEVPTVASVSAAWVSARAQAIAEIVEKNGGAFDLQLHGCQKVRVPLCAWSPAKAEAWWHYGCMRKRLADELGARGVAAVPPLRAVRHEGTVKSLCEWRPGSACVLPRTDLVLVRREKERKGLFRMRRVAEEGLVPSEQLWKILRAHSEVRSEPVEMLIHRTTPPDVVARLDGMALEPLEHARNALLLGVVDCEIPATP
jgi:hypothetical protein